MNTRLQRMALKVQQGEITEHYIYAGLAKRTSNAHNKRILQTIAADELVHYKYWRSLTKVETKPNKLLIWWYVILASVLGVTFALKLREEGEEAAQRKYATLRGVKGIDKLIADEERHEKELINILKDERLDYAGSIVLGLNDALVELTGVLAGFTLAFNNGRTVAIAGLITGIAAALSMGVSGYFQGKEEHTKNPIKSALYTGVTYILVVLLLVAPYFVFTNLYVALAVTLIFAILVIAGYTFYIATAKDQSFWKRFIEMVVVSLTVAAISFLVGWLLNKYLGV